MTITEIAKAIEAETHSLTWAEAPPEVRVLVIKHRIEWLDELQTTEEPAKKVAKQRKPRKAKAVAAAPGEELNG